MNMSNFDQCRKWFGIIWLIIELNLISANIFGFSALFNILPQYNIYSNYCQLINKNNSIEEDCSGRTQQYQVNQFKKNNNNNKKCDLIIECINIGYYIF